MRLCKEIVAAIPKSRLPVVCSLTNGAYCGSYAWLTIMEDLSFEYKAEHEKTRVYSFDEMYDAFLLSFDYSTGDLAIAARFDMRKSAVRKALTKYRHKQEFAPRALGLALSSNRMDIYNSGCLVELLGWLKNEGIKYSLDITMVEV